MANSRSDPGVAHSYFGKADAGRWRLRVDTGLTRCAGKRIERRIHNEGTIRAVMDASHSLLVLTSIPRLERVRRVLVVGSDRECREPRVGRRCCAVLRPRRT
jgi:hypothetical protein